MILFQVEEPKQGQAVKESKSRNKEYLQNVNREHGTHNRFMLCSQTFGDLLLATGCR